MNGEPQPAVEGDKLDRALFGLKVVWFGMFAGGLVVTLTLAVVVMSGGGVNARLGALGYIFLIPVPFALLAAYVLVPRLVPREPAAIVRAANARGAMYEGWEGTKPDEPYYWFPAFAAQFFIKVGLLEGAAIFCAIGFLVTADWVILGGAGVLLGALAVELPTRSAVESFAAAAQQRQRNAG